jgi:hypothetical protein
MPRIRPDDDAWWREVSALYRDGVVEGIALAPADDDACEVCERRSGVFEPRALPKLPISTCEKSECRCRYEIAYAVVE